ncbi:VTT domain-containing protein [Aliiglaciecola lipolytica]|uniref:Phospholipase D/Transphosphatidylase n=1 Tax=Aliiglaciecola lipolytica E3 TaxID=1127673 RepID=K6XX75_9ALTE|nr:VTT domain-containing protein [Aliiglaciecola lipolytica]GAC16246.1 phospholipase D/Transphosphatidylase [Aliiglaciecola lipolytica E3]
MDAANTILQNDEVYTLKSTARYAAPVVDCANYYRALHEAIEKAQRSIFIVGWDIDSRVRLLRGEEEKASELPSVISELINLKASENPDLRVYLLRWDSSLAFFGMREIWAKEVWDEKTPENVHTVLDGSIPMGGSQHQKIVIIDDELAFSGGMDVAVHRWDTREHRLVEPERDDGDGSYGPFHDVQVAVSGPIVKELSKLVRWRWNRLVDETQQITESTEQRHPDNTDQLPNCWPQSVKPLLENIDCAVSQTIPFMDDVEPVQEVRKMLLALIEQAEEFIYIENQFANRGEIAEALNRRLKACPKLRVLIVSSYQPKGTMETEAYWAGRIDFKRILENGIEDERVLVAYSGSTNKEGVEGQKRVHAKVMVIDDAYFVIGSSNLSNRSMSLDTECDLTFVASTEKHREQIAWFRNDLISEHAGWSVEDVQSFIDGENTFKQLTQCKEKYAYCLHEADDKIFTDQSLQQLLTPIGDPQEPIVPSIPLFNGKRLSIPNPSKRGLVITATIVIIALLVGGGYLLSQNVDWMSKDHLQALLESLRDSPWAIIAVCGIYIIAGILFFPVTVLSLAVAMVFGAVWGVIYGMAGVMASTAVLFFFGHLIGDKGLRSFIGPKINKIDKKFAENGIFGVAVIRMIPIAPFSLVNLVAGISSIKLVYFLAGTFLGMLPPMIIKGVVGGSIADIIRDPTPKHIGLLVGGLVAWILLAYGSQKLVNYFQNTRGKSKNLEQSATEVHEQV